MPGQRAIAIIFLQNKNMSRQYKVTGIRLEAVVGIATSILFEEGAGAGTDNSTLELPKSRIRPTGPRLPKVGTRFLPEKDREWKTARADNLIFAVHVLVDDEVRKGVIMTDRVALNPSTVWVKTLDSAGKEKHLNVPASDIEILSIEG